MIAGLETVENTDKGEILFNNIDVAKKILEIGILVCISNTMHF